MIFLVSSLLPTFRNSLTQKPTQWRCQLRRALTSVWNPWELHPEMLPPLFRSSKDWRADLSARAEILALRRERLDSGGDSVLSRLLFRSNKQIIAELPAHAEMMAREFVRGGLAAETGRGS